MRLRRLVVGIVLVFSFVLSFAVLYRAYRDMSSVTPGDHQTRAAAADLIIP